MNANEPTGRESTESVDRRDRRAVTECMTVLCEAPDVYSVTSQSGREYIVDARTGACTCPDSAYNLPAHVPCKHARRVAIVTGAAPMPAVDPADVDPLLGEHVSPTVATDGGEPTDDVDECETCARLGTLPCFECFEVREGGDQ